MDVVDDGRTDVEGIRRGRCGVCAKDECPRYYSPCPPDTECMVPLFLSFSLLFLSVSLLSSWCVSLVLQVCGCPARVHRILGEGGRKKKSKKVEAEKEEEELEREAVVEEKGELEKERVEGVEWKKLPSFLFVGALLCHDSTGVHKVAYAGQEGNASSLLKQSSLN
jgi:hypothetical protein